MKTQDLILEEQLCFALYRASRSLTRHYTKRLSPLGLTYPQYVVMITLWESNDQSVKDLGEKLCLDSATLTPVLKKLETAGFVTRERDTSDERVVRINLTSKGRQLFHKAKKIPREIFEFVSSSPDSKTLITRLTNLRRDLHLLSDVLDAE